LVAEDAVDEGRDQAALAPLEVGVAGEVFGEDPVGEAAALLDLPQDLDGEAAGGDGGRHGGRRSCAIVGAMSIRRAVVAAALGLSCAGPVGCDEPLAPVSEAQTLLEQIGDYSTWGRPMSRPERAASTALHGPFVDVLVNDVVAADEADPMIPEGGLTEWSEGATIVLEGYDMLEGGARVQRAIMQKRYGVWWWEQYLGEETAPRFSGRVDVCRGCHGAGEDFVRSFRLPDPPMM